ncbi:MAG: hypothetical protein JST81_13635 [Bacteroidetes bacterium]|nr:hypothetical protein [Bacteroidota bacterium]
MKWSLLFVAAIFMSSLGVAQITLNAQLPPAGIVKKDQLWNLILTNNKDAILDISITLYLKDAVSGQVILSANSNRLSISKGSKIITSRDVEPVTYNQTGAGISGNYIPLGSYIACYQIFDMSGGETALNEECVNINIDPLSPPMLNQPYDKSEIETAYPQFSWLPPTPVEMFSNLSYEIVVAEVLDGQSPSQAIQSNTPVYSKINLTRPFDMFNSSFSKLEEGKTYAWQVIVRNDVSYAGKTEVWTFKLKKQEKLPDIVALTPYLQMKTFNPLKGIAPNGILKISYPNKTPETKIDIEIIESAGKNNDNKTVSFSINILRGENNIEFNLNKIMKVSEDKVYTARLHNSMSETWLVQFVVKNYKN